MNVPGTHFALGAELIPGPWYDRNMSLKNPVTPPGIDPEAVRIVVQRSALTPTLPQAPTKFIIALYS
jgi:hypothetical protein